jgi:hypothetical protein
MTINSSVRSAAQIVSPVSAAQQHVKDFSTNISFFTSIGTRIYLDGGNNIGQVILGRNSSFLARRCACASTVVLFFDALACRNGGRIGQMGNKKMCSFNRVVAAFLLANNLEQRLALRWCRNGRWDLYQ